MRILGLVAAYSLPECKLLKIAGDGAVTVADSRAFQIVKKIAGGAVPKRHTSGILHTE